MRKIVKQMVTPVIMAAFLATTSYSVFAANEAVASTKADVNASKVVATSTEATPAEDVRQNERFAQVTPAMAGLPVPAVSAATTATAPAPQVNAEPGQMPTEAMVPKAPQAQADAPEQTKQPTRQSPQVQQERDRLAKEASAEPATATKKVKAVEDKTSKKADAATDAKAQAKAAKAEKEAKQDKSKSDVKKDKKAAVDEKTAPENENAVIARNGENFAFKADNQKLQGNVLADEQTTIQLALTNGSAFAGAINSDNKAKSAELFLSKDSVWEVTGDSNITKLTNEDPTNSNIHTNGYKVNIKK